MSKLQAMAAIAALMYVSPMQVAVAQDEVKISGSILPETKTPGRFTVTIRFDIKEGWHTYGSAGAGSEEQTTLDMKLPKGAQVVGAWDSPVGADGITEGSIIHVGKVEFTRSIAVAELARGKKIPVTIHYQACTDEFCNPPQKKVVVLRIPASDRLAKNSFEAPVRIMANHELLNAKGRVRFLSPTLHDLDGDGRAELILGSLMGRVSLYRNLNTSGQGDPVWGPREDFRGARSEPIRTSNW